MLANHNKLSRKFWAQNYLALNKQLRATTELMLIIIIMALSQWQSLNVQSFLNRVLWKIVVKNDRF